MRFYLLFPLAFLSGIHGFALFTPYLVLILLAGKLIARRRRRNAAVVLQAENETVAIDGVDVQLPVALTAG